MVNEANDTAVAVTMNLSNENSGDNDAIPSDSVVRLAKKKKEDKTTASVLELYATYKKSRAELKRCKAAIDDNKANLEVALMTASVTGEVPDEIMKWIKGDIHSKNDEC